MIYSKLYYIIIYCYLSFEFIYILRLSRILSLKIQMQMALLNFSIFSKYIFRIIVIAFPMCVYFLIDSIMIESISSDTILLILQENISQDKRIPGYIGRTAKNNKNS